jgi:hypothetical protein
MTTALTSNGIGAAAGWSLTNTVDSLSGPSGPNGAQGFAYPFNNNFRFSPSQFSAGVGAGQVDRLVVLQGAIPASGNSVLTLTNYTDAFGNVVSMARVKLIYVDLPYNATTQASSISIGNATNPLLNWITPSTATKPVRNGGCLFDHAGSDATGYTVTAGSGDQLKILNNDGAKTASFRLCIMGCST